MLRVLLSRVRATLRRSRLDDELDDELREHLAMLQERFVRNGMDPSEAFYAARRQFGGVTQVKEALMERSALPSMRAAFADLRYAFRARRCGRQRAGAWHRRDHGDLAVMVTRVARGRNVAVLYRNGQNHKGFFQ